MTSPQDISRIYKSTDALTFDDFMRGLLLRLGASSQAVAKWLPSSGVRTEGHDSESSDPVHNDYGHLGEQLCRKQLLPGKNLDKLQAILINNIQQSLQWHKLPENVSPYYSQEAKTVSLLEWCCEVLLDAATHAFFDDYLMEIDSKLFKHFFVFDELSWKLHFGYPRVFARKMYSAKDRIIDALTTYFERPIHERKGQAWLVGNLESEMRLLGIENRDIAAIIMPLYWVYVVFLQFNYTMIHVIFHRRISLSYDLRSADDTSTGSTPTPTKVVSGQWPMCFLIRHFLLLFVRR